MDAQNLINSLNSLSEKLFKSIEGQVYEEIDKIVNITPNIFKDEPLKNIFFQDKVNILIVIANALILFYIIYFTFSKMISVYNGNRCQNVYIFVIRLVLVSFLVNSSYLITKEVININYVFTDSIDKALEQIAGTSIDFQNLKENILKIDDLLKSDMLSLNGVIKGVISFGSISILISFAIRYVTVIFLLIISPFAFVSLSSNLTVGIFKTWIKTLFVTLMVQFVVKFIIFIPIMYKHTNNISYKVILVGAIYILYKVNNFTKELFTKISSDLPNINIFSN